jgi:hypothetical protein
VAEFGGWFVSNGNSKRLEDPGSLFRGIFDIRQNEFLLVWFCAGLLLGLFLQAAKYKVLWVSISDEDVK